MRRETYDDGRVVELPSPPPHPPSPPEAQERYDLGPEYEVTKTTNAAGAPTGHNPQPSRPNRKSPTGSPVVNISTSGKADPVSCAAQTVGPANVDALPDGSPEPRHDKS